MSETNNTLLVLGGGSAGWLTAALLAAEHPGLRISLVESPDQPIIGVGEGTWPSMRDTLRRIGLPELELLRHCEASFKQGSRFDGWSAPGERYHHPFSLPHGFGEVELVNAWLAEGAGRPYAEAVSPQPQLADAGRAPKQAGTPAYAAVLNYAYHFDAVKFGQLLREHAVNRLGVLHVIDHVEAVIPRDDGGIAALQTRGSGQLAADFFVDCSGMASRLLGQHHGVGLKSERATLFNDAALAIQVPYALPDQAMASVTIATAWAKGWIWDIGLPTRRGVGCVYSRSHASDEEANEALQAYLDASGAPAERAQPRRIAFEPGYRERFWVKNCVAIGLSAGFIEPLEASALALVEQSAARLSAELPLATASLDAVARRFNEDFGYRWARIIDFLKLHYCLSRRDDSEYWRAHRDPASWTERLHELLPQWQRRAPARHDLGRLDEVFPPASYQYVLYGMGFRPQAGRIDPAAAACLAEVQARGRQMLPALPSHRALLQHYASP